jgi:signal transduction histidine kinase
LTRHQASGIDGQLDKARTFHATLATLIHDLRGPVSRVKAVAELLREEIAVAPANSPEANAALEWLMIINRATDNIDEVLENILEAARSTAGPLPPVPVNSESAESRPVAPPSPPDAS